MEGKNCHGVKEYYRRRPGKVTIQAMIDKEQEIEALRETITALRFEAQEMEKEIEGLRRAVLKRTREL